MANSLDYAKRFVPIIDDIYKMAAITEGMDAATRVDFTGVNEVKVLKVSTTGLGDYSRATGYPKGDITAAWETMRLTEERGKELSIDRMDNEEMLGMVFGHVTGTFLRDHVAPGDRRLPLRQVCKRQRHFCGDARGAHQGHDSPCD